MAKCLKQKIAKVMPSFQSCRSKDTSILPIIPQPFSSSTSKLNSNLTNLHFSRPTNPPPPLPSQSTSAASGVYLPSTFTHSRDDPKLTAQFRWRKDDKWHIVAKVYDRSIYPRQKTRHSISSASGFDHDVLGAPALPCPSLSQKKKKQKHKKKMVPELRISTSSAESGLFSGQSFGVVDDEETEALASSPRSSEFNHHLKKNRGKTFTPRRKKKKRTAKKELHSPGCESPARLSVFQRLMPCAVEGKVRESFAVVKKSENPYNDFKRSMMEMIVEKEMFDENDLVQLLHCLVSLNDKQHHGVIIEAFSEIWETLFSRRSTRR